MREKVSAQKVQNVSVTVQEFQKRLDQFKATNNPSDRNPEGVSVYSRLALIHQVAKAYALEAIASFTDSPIELAIDEITNPPLYDQDNSDEPVVIQFSYYS